VTSVPPEDLQATYVATLVDEWARGGVSHAVVCPGSRSTPLAVALAAHRAIRVLVRLDERSASFTALGIGLASGRPALLVTTSGTAAAEVHAAVVEADLARVPLVVLTADRPPELQGFGAPQTIDQTHLYGRSVRWFADPGPADAGSRGTWRSLAARSVAEAVAGPQGPGPVHLNLAFREPLLGAVSGTDPGRSDGGPWHRVVRDPGAAPAGAVAAVADTARRGARGVLVAGAGCGDPAAVVALASALGWPLLADPRSGARTDDPLVIGGADLLARVPIVRSALAPDVVVHLGAPWVSKPLGQWLAARAADGADVLAVDPCWRWVDPDRAVSTVVPADPEAFCRAVVEAVGPADGPAGGSEGGAWLASWRAAEAAVRQVLDPRTVDGPGAVTEPGLAAHLVRSLPGDATLVVSSSMPVRDVETFGAPRAHPPRVLANRGANGIDGVVSTALGVAAGSPPGRATVALVGDLAFLHDVSSLVRPGEDTAPCTVVVADNGGGGIFSFLPQATALDDVTFETLFGTPQLPDVADVAAGFGVPVDDVGDAAGLHEALARRVGEGLSVIRVRLPSREDNLALHRQLEGDVATAVDAVLRGTAEGRDG
jgi:2-succinyl-5-enolpyruvyl-6-hydroxy-3-cyclohexene-1-carboxylate synthase